MDAELNGGIHPFCNSRPPRANRFGKGNMEWDLNGWMWDGDLFVATPVNAALSDCRNGQLFPTPALGSLSNRSPSSSGDSDPGINVNGKGELEKRRREVLVVDEDEPEDESSSLTLKLGGRVYPVTGHGGISNGDDKNGKKSKVQVVAVCQVEGCGAELSEAKDYHRRHKVCEMHAKASKALVGKVLQRFCQQCSRFHLLQEFDEGKRSCRRRLAGHNKRRRKNQPDPVSNATSLADERASSYLLISLLRILTNLHSDGSPQVKNQDLLSHLLKNLGSLAGSLDMNNIPGILKTSQEEENIGTCAGPPLDTGHASPSNCVATQESLAVCSDAKINYTTEIPGSFTKQPNRAVCVPVASAKIPCQVDAMAPGSTLGKVRFRSFDLNDVYNNEHDIIEVPERFSIHGRQSPGSLHLPSWMLNNSHKSSPPQTSGNSDSTSVQSQSTSNGEAQCRTDRMIFKLFDKDPSKFPLALRSQILDWLSNSPTDMEGYIRPGCIILTVYLRLPESRWTELYHNLRTYLERLLDVAEDNFWRTGWLYARIRNQIAFAYNGCVVLDTPLLDVHNNCQILSVTPIAVSSSERVKFTVRGVNLTQSSIRLLCAFDGKYLVQEITQPLSCSSSNSAEYDEDQCLHISCSVPSATGRGFIEVEDHGLSCSFFPFIVADKEVSSEIRALECAFSKICSDENVVRMKARVEALDFLHEMGWLLRRSHLSFTSEGCNSYASMYPLVQFIWLIEFAIGRSWCAVVKKLLDILFGGVVNTDGKSIELALSDMALLHNAVQQNQTSVVKLLLEYMPPYEEETSPQSSQMKRSQKGLLFRPDVLGPFDLTPLHIAASRCDAKNLLDALTDDPGQVGIKAWKTARDSSGFTPEDYARSKGYESYMHLMQKKAKQGLGSEHVIVDISGISDMDAILKPTSGPVSVKTMGSLQVHKSAPFVQPSCRTCPPLRLSYGIHHSNLAYRPTMLFMVGIAAVCVCVGILLHSPPQVFSLITPFRWELLDCGYI